MPSANLQHVACEMRNIFISIILSFPTFSYAQSLDSLRTSWERIFVFDNYAGWSYYHNEFEIRRSDGGFVLVDMSDATWLRGLAVWYLS